jgi:predicted ATPase
MTYRHSHVDTKNLDWFTKDNSRATLLTVDISLGQVRGLRNVKVDFQYPITAIAGRNGSCKTTVLGIAACAFHNSDENGFKLPGRKRPYYTFSDFLIQTKEESALGRIQIRYKILYNNWKPSERFPDGIGEGWQVRIKKRSSRWNNYPARVDRTVVFLGVERIVPHSERSVSKSYRGKFKPVSNLGWEDDVRNIVGRILATDYESFSFRRHTKYRIPIVAKKNGNTYSGFNMGAGEHSLFELFSIIHECPDGSLILIDEIELGLHEQAQEKLILELKTICQKRKFQIICTTHSPRILDALPPKGRIFVERLGTETTIIPGISSAYATGKLSGRSHSELEILVEDEAAELILKTALDRESRSRSQICPIGSDTAVMRYAAAKFKEMQRKSNMPEICVILDGDKASVRSNQIQQFLNALENTKNADEARDWIDKRLIFLPGNKWPELWVVSPPNKNPFYKRLASELEMTSSEVDDLLEVSARAGKHKEFDEASRILNLPRDVIVSYLIKSAFEAEPERLVEIQNFIRGWYEK